MDHQTTNSTTNEIRQPLRVRENRGKQSRTRRPFWSTMRRWMESVGRFIDDERDLPHVVAPFADQSFFDVAWIPRVEVTEKNGQLQVLADLPGVRLEDLHVQLDGDMLTISGHRERRQERNEGGVHHSEISYGSFQRGIRVSPDLDPNAIEARFHEGVLKLTVPAPRPAVGKSIEIKPGRGGRDGEKFAS